MATIVTFGAGKDYSTCQAAIDAVVALGALTDDYDIVGSGGETFTAGVGVVLAVFTGLLANGKTVTLRGETRATTGWPILTQTNDVNLINADVTGVSFKWLYLDKLSAGGGNYAIASLRGTAEELHVRMPAGAGNEKAISTSGSVSNQNIRNVMIYLKAGTGTKYNGGIEDSGSSPRIYFCTVRDASGFAVQANSAALIKDNIFANCTLAASRAHNGTWDYNCYSNVTTVANVSDVNKTFAEFQALGKEANGIEADALLTSTTDLHLLTGSPCINAGLAIAGITTDIDGDTRSDPPDIGADEFVATDPPKRRLTGSAKFSALMIP